MREKGICVKELACTIVRQVKFAGSPAGRKFEQALVLQSGIQILKGLQNSFFPGGLRLYYEEVSTILQLLIDTR